MNILLITPPLTQLNTPYPATACLLGFMKSKNYNISQVDLGIELIHELFTQTTLAELFEEAVNHLSTKVSSNAVHILSMKNRYLQTIDTVMRFLRGEDPTLATRICSGHYLPEASRFRALADMEWAFGALGMTDKARHFATLYLEDLTDFIRETLNPHFELGRYAEHLSLLAPVFEPLRQSLQKPLNFIDRVMLAILSEKIALYKPGLVGFSIPFPGNLYGALKCGQFLKNEHPTVKIAWGGGYVNTELRQLTDPSVFDYTDYILFDDGELPLWKLAALDGSGNHSALVRTKFRNELGNIESVGWGNEHQLPFGETTAPDYSGLKLHQYISLIETANPMHKLWSDGRWNKLTLAHGCYWAKCAFCDTSLPYIRNYEPLPANVLADRIESIVGQTGTTGFHFTDEAAPPKLLRELSEEILCRKLSISWWANIRFEKAFDQELCSLLAQAGCIAVSGGMEVASNRLLKLMNKGVTIEQAALTAHHFTNHGMMVHAYLMYGFPTQTVQETIDALEVVRQFFHEGLIQSAFWHRYAMTVHSPSGIHPENFGAKCIEYELGSFANNEIPFNDGQQIDLEQLGEGLRKATYNYMHGVCLDRPVSKWFSSKVPQHTIPKNYIRNYIQKQHN